LTISLFKPYKKTDVDDYIKEGWWRGITLGELEERAAASFSSREAIVDGQIRLTSSELHEIIQRLALGFIKLGIAKGDTVLLQLPNWAEFVYSYFALQKIGVVPVLLISGYKFLEVSHLCKLTDAVAWIVPETYRDIEYTSFIDEVKKVNPQLRHVILARANKLNSDFIINLETLVETRIQGTDKQQLVGGPQPTDIAHILPTGGTTGLPKGIPRTHNDYICNVEFLHKVGEMNSNDICLLAVPVGHNLGLLNVTGSILVPYKLVLVDSTRPADICRIAQQEKATYMPTVPSLLKRLIDFEKLKDYDLGSIKKISAGGEASSPELVRKAIATLGCKYLNEFGMVEGILCRSRLTYDIEKVSNTVGKPCCPGDKIKIIDHNDSEVPAKIDGQMVTSGPGIFKGYINNPVENQKCFTTDGFFRSGDLATINEEGDLKITGRIKDIIIRGGENISPAQVEELLRRHPDIADATVVGVPDKELGEKVCAFIKLKQGARADTENIKRFMQQEGASKLLIPEQFEFVDTLPMTEFGKHDKKALRDDLRRRSAQR
jgi:2,3-dihydroxybenzoate-AMP ligase